MSFPLFFRKSRGALAFAFVLAALLLPHMVLAALPQPVEQNLGAMLDLSQQRGTAVSQQDFGPLLDYVTKASGDARDLVPEKRYGGNGSVLRVTMKRPLSHIIRYCYNPDIPDHLIYPSVLRLSGWQPGSDLVDKEPKPWNLLPRLDKPVALWGTEYQVNAPDSFGGGYYRCDLNRLLVLTKMGGKNVLISVSKQKDKSSVGKKAVILDEGEWNYFYSGINGLNKGLVGWADTYMYDSASVQVFIEDGPHQTTLMIFKWLRAGWASMNVVMKNHINDGLTRYATAFKKIVESDSLPDADDFAARVRELSTMSDAELDCKILAYALAIENIAKTSPAMNKSEFQKVVEGGKYAKIMNREERVGAILVEYLKSRLGKRPLVDFPTTPGARPKTS